MTISIPFNRPSLAGNEMNYIAQAFRNGHLSGDGPFTKQCHTLIERQLGVERALLTTSCTHALEMAAILLDIQAGDEVIVPAFTFVSTINAFVMRGARPVFVDIRPDTLNLDEVQLAMLISDRTKAIVVMHYAGVGCEMDDIQRSAQGREAVVVEDNAHGLFGLYRNKHLGTFGALAAQSFHETKNVSCGEGGALLINDPRFCERAEIIREKGTNRSRFFRGEIDKYGWVDIGSSYLPSEILAAVLLAQLEAADEIQAKRRQIWEYYDQRLRDWARARGICQPLVPTHTTQAYHMYYLLMPALAQRQAFIAHLKQRGILAVFHYLPLHLSEMGKRFGGRSGDCPVTESISERLVRLPFYCGLTEADLGTVVEAILDFDLV